MTLLAMLVAPLVVPGWSSVMGTTTLSVNAASSGVPAGTEDFFRISGRVAASFPGGAVDVRWQPASSQCAASPGSDTGRAPTHGGITTVAAGPRAIVTNGYSVSVTFPSPGPYLVCAWLIDSSGAVTAHAESRSTAAPPVGCFACATPVAGWHPLTAACQTLTKTEAARALELPLVISAGGHWDGGDTEFEQSNNSLCQWGGTRVFSTLTLVLMPEQAPAQLGHLLSLFNTAGSDCRTVADVGRSACVAGSDLYAVQGRLGVSIDLVPNGLTAAGTASRRLQQEELLARKAFTRVAFAHQ